MTEGRVTLFFDETVRSSSIAFSDLSLQTVREHTSLSEIEIVTLSGGNISSSDGTLVEVLLSSTDLNTIKSITSLANSRSTTFLSYNSGAVIDMSGNKVIPRPASEGLQVHLYSPD